MNFDNDFTTYLKAYGVENASNTVFNAKLPKTTLAFASKIQSAPNNTIEDIATIASEVFAAEANSTFDYDQHFIPLTTQTKHFSVHASRSSSDVVVVICNNPLLSLWEESILLQDTTAVVVRISQLFTKPIVSENIALFLIASPNSIQGVEITLSPIPTFELPEHAEPWLQSTLQPQNNLIEKAIAYGYLRRFPTAEPGNSLKMLLDAVTTPKAFEWNTSHPVQQEIIQQFFRRNIALLTERLPTLTEENVEEWLLLRDQIQSLRVVLAEVDASTEPDLLLQQMDSKFPHIRFSPHLPQNQLLGKAYQFDPLCWWGKSAKMRELYDRLLHNH